MTEEQYLREYEQVWEFMDAQTGQVTWNPDEAREWHENGITVDSYIIDVPLSEFNHLAEFMGYKPLD